MSGEVGRRLELFKQALKRSGIKLTHQRLVIFSELARSGEHPDAEKVYRKVREKMPTVSLDTVYRNLWLLLDLGLITTLGTPRDRARFDANMRPHHHFVCSKCGKTHDFYSKEFDSMKIPPVVKSFGRVEKAQVEVRGICLQCFKARKKDPYAKRRKGKE